MLETQFHLLVAKWLSENGYYYEHEVKMPEFGRADFVAKHQDGHVLVVECKVGTNASDGRSIIQLVDYCRQLAGSRGAYAFPSELSHDKIRSLCDLYNVRFLPIDVHQTVEPALLGGSNLSPTYKEKRNEAIAEQVKQIACAQMAKEGISVLSLRAIARELGVTAPALYRYFPNCDAIITALIMDAYNAQAETLEFADKAQFPSDFKARVMTFALTYRRWALDNAADYQLLHSAPVPHYHFPAEYAVPMARRSFVMLAEILSEAFLAEKLTFTPYYESLPEEVVNHIHTLHEQGLPEMPPEILYMSVGGWARLEGAISLEQAGLLDFLVGNPTEFYYFEVKNLIRDAGLME